MQHAQSAIFYVLGSVKVSARSSRIISIATNPPNENPIR